MIKKKVLIILVVIIFILALFVSKFTGFSIFVDYSSITRQLITSSTQVFLDIIFQVNVDSPGNVTYNFSKGDDYLINVNVSSNRIVSYWNFTLIDWRHNRTINNSSPLTPNITIRTVRWQNELIVFATDIGGNTRNSSLMFSVYIPNSAPVIENLSGVLYVCENNYLSYLFNASDVDEDTLSYSMSSLDPFYINSVTINDTLTAFEIFSGVLNKTKAGGVNAGYKIYPETITVNDGSAIDSENINITIIEINNAPSLENIGVQTVWTKGENSSFNYQASVVDIEDGNQDSGNLSFNISFSSGNLFNISLKGVMNFTPNSSQIGVYNISVCVRDKGLINPYQNISLCNQNGTNISVCDTFSLTITSENRAPIITSYYPLTLNFSANESDTISFNLSSRDPDGTIPDAYWYVDYIFKEYDSENLNVYFNYTFNCTSSGQKTIIGKVTDGAINSSYSYVLWNVTVFDSPSCAYCGDGICNNGESCSTCSGDCGSCPVSPPGGGPGGGGGGATECTEKWGCSEWQDCKNLSLGFESKEIDKDSFSKIKKNCENVLWKEDVCGFQRRACEDVNKCRTNKSKPGTVRECYYVVSPNCSDGIKNCHDGSCEQLVDCGGPCNACPTCNDGIKNQGEEDIDCGGLCQSCARIREIPKEVYKGLEKIFVYLIIPILLVALFFIARLIIKYHIIRKSLKEMYEKHLGYRRQDEK